MKERNYTWLSISTFIVLAVLLGIQVLFLFKAAQMEERNFNHRVLMALKDSRDELARRICPDMDQYLCGKECSGKTRMRKEAEVDSIIRSNLCLYHLPTRYTFVLSDSIGHVNSRQIFGVKYYEQSLNGLLQNQGIGIQIFFPERNRFLLRQMQGLFAVSVIGILFLVMSYIMLLRMIRREKMQMAHTREFVNNMLHEFQTPLANIRLAANLILKKKAEGDKSNEYTGVILKEYERMHAHVNDILSISCDPVERSEKNILDLKVVLQEVANSFSYRFEEAQAQLSLNYAAGDHTIASNNGRLAQVFSNLLDNALKYGGANPVVRVDTRIESRHLLISVSDNGIGIARKDLPYIFDQYFRVSTGDVHDVKGFGIGLSFVKKVIEEHKGSIRVESAVGKGSSFIIVLPLFHG